MDSQSQTVYVGVELKERAKEVADRQRTNLGAVATLGLGLFAEGKLGPLVDAGGPYPLTADRVLFLVDPDALEEAQDHLPEGKTMSDVYRTIFRRFVDGELRVGLIREPQ